MIIIKMLRHYSKYFEIHKDFVLISDSSMVIVIIYLGQLSFLRKDKWKDIITLNIMQMESYNKLHLI